MLKEISLFASIIALNLNPVSSNSNVSREFMNSTDYVIHVNESASVQAHSSYTFTLPSSTFTDMYIDIFSETEPTGVYYWLNQVDNEQEVLITFTRVPVGGTPRWEFDIPDISVDTIKGIQFFTKKSLVDEVYYIQSPSVHNAEFHDSNILPENSSALLYQNNDTSVSITSLALDRVEMTTGMIGYTSLTVNSSTVIASNSRTGRVPNGMEEVTNVVMYYGSYTNKIKFSSGYYPRGYNTKGYNEINPLFTKDYNTYISITSANNVGTTLAPLEVGFQIMGKVLEALNSFFGYMLLPGISIGVVIAIPLIILIVLFILKLIKKG